MQLRVLGLCAAWAFVAAAQEMPVSPPRMGPAPGQRLDGSLARGAEWDLAVWLDPRAVTNVYAARVRRDGRVLDPDAIRIVPPDDHYLSAPAAAVAGDTIVVAAGVWRMAGSSAGAKRIGVLRLRADGTRIDRDFTFLGEGSNPSVAWNGEFFLVAWTTRRAVELALLSPRLEVVRTAKLDGRSVHVTASGGRFLCVVAEDDPADGVVAGDDAVRGVILGDGTAGEPFVIAEGRYPAAVTAAVRDGWAVAVARDTIDLCAVRAAGAVACQSIARAETTARVRDVAAVADGVIVAWEAARPNHYATVPPQVIFDLRLTHVTARGAAELHAKPGAPAADDDILLSLEPGEALRVGRNGVVAHVPIALGAPEQTLYALLPSGDGATAFWGEAGSTHAAPDLRATRFTGAGIDAGLHDRMLGAGVRPLGSDGVNVLLSDGRLIDPAGNVARTVPVPREPVMAGWDGAQWVIATYSSLHRGAEMLPSAGGYPSSLACTNGACVLAWIEERREPGYRVDIGAWHIAAGRPLAKVQRTAIASDTGSRLSVGVAAAGGALLVAWSDARRNEIHGRIFSARGRLSTPFRIATAVSPRDPLYFQTGSTGAHFVVVQNAWPVMRVHRIAPGGTTVSTHDVPNGTARGAAAAGGERVLLFYERAAPELPYASTRRAFGRFAD